MSKLIKCPTCGRQVSSNAAACPACAEPINRVSANTGRVNLRDPVHILGVVASVVVAFLLLTIIGEAVSNVIGTYKMDRLRERNQQKALIERQQRMDALKR